MNPLTLLTQVPPHIRKAFYVGYALAVLVAGCIQVAYETSDGMPHWMKVSLRVLAYIGGLLGLTAASNVQLKAKSPDTVVDEPDSPPED